MARAMWKGAIQFGLVTIPVKLYLATESSYQVRFNMLHEKDLSRIQMKTYCPVDDEVISRADTVKGYEYAPDQYVVITDEDLEKVPLKTVRTIEIEQFTKAERDDTNTKLRQAGLLHRARQDRPQGVLPPQVGPRRGGPHGDLQGRDQGSRGARLARSVRRHDAPHDPPLARRDPLDEGARPARGGARLQAGRAGDGQAARVGDDRRVRAREVPRRVPRGAHAGHRGQDRGPRGGRRRSPSRRPATSSTSWPPSRRRSRRRRPPASDTPVSVADAKKARASRSPRPTRSRRRRRPRRRSARPPTPTKPRSRPPPQAGEAAAARAPRRSE